MAARGGLLQLVAYGHIVAIVDRDIAVQPFIIRLARPRPLGFLERVFGRNQNEHIE